MQQPTHVRYTIVALITVVNLICYADRIAIAIGAPSIQKELGFAPAQMGLILGIFSLAYALGQTPWGMAADRWGSRLIIAGGILSWSAFTALTAIARNFISMAGIRFTFGALEASLAPSTAVAFARWTPVRERSTAFGTFLGGGRLGAALTPPLAAYLLLRFGWRAMFMVVGLAGIPATLVWLAWFRDDPRVHSWTNEGERELLSSLQPATAGREPVSWPSLLGSGRLWSLLGVSFAITFMWQFYITWFPTYLMQKRGMRIQEAAFYAGMPFLFGVAGSWLGGIGTDFLSGRIGLRKARLWVGWIGMGLSGSLMAAGIFIQTPRLGALLMASAAFTTDLYLGAAWACAVEIGGAAAGAVAGMTNATSNFAAFASPVLMGMILQLNGSWNTVLIAGILSTYLGAFLWTYANPAPTEKIRPMTPVETL